MAMAMRMLLHLLAIGVARALAPLSACKAAGRSGRFGICSGAATPIVLRGSNYIRLGGPEGSGTYHSTFDTCAVNCYNRSRFLAAFKAMQYDGYNINRVFLDALPGRGIGGNTTATAALDPAWMDRLALYIADAEAHGIYTMVTMVRVPNNAYFRNFSASHSPPLGPEWQTWNAAFLTQAGQAAFAEYGARLSAGLKDRLPDAAQQNAVLVSLQNEFFLNGDEYPFGPHRNISVTLGDGVKYDMHSAKDRQQAADANTNRWATRARDQIRQHLPTTLVTVGVFTFRAVQKDGPNGLALDGCNSAAGTGTGAMRASSAAVDCRFPARPFWPVGPSSFPVRLFPVSQYLLLPVPAYRSAQTRC